MDSSQIIDSSVSFERSSQAGGLPQTILPELLECSYDQQTCMPYPSPTLNSIPRLPVLLERESTCISFALPHTSPLSESQNSNLPFVTSTPVCISITTLDDFATAPPTSILTPSKTTEAHAAHVDVTSGPGILSPIPSTDQSTTLPPRPDCIRTLPTDNTPPPYPISHDEPNNNTHPNIRPPTPNHRRDANAPPTPTTQCSSNHDCNLCDNEYHQLKHKIEELVCLLVSNYSKEFDVIGMEIQVLREQRLVVRKERTLLQGELALLRRQWDDVVAAN